jgi:hypothetical protein
MMGRFFVVSALMVLSCFGVVTRGMRMVLRRLLMMLGCLFGHWLFPPLFPRGTRNARFGDAFLYDKHCFAIT